MDIELPITIRRQPDYTTCGPTSLHAANSFYGDSITPPEVIEQTARLEGGGTLGVHLALHALKRGYEAGICVRPFRRGLRISFEGRKRSASPTR